MKKLVLLVAVCLTVIGICFAEGDYIGDLGVVVVTPTGFGRAAAFIPLNVKVITAEDIEHSGAKIITDLLRTEGGIIVNDWFGSGNRVSIDMLGFGETAQSNVLVMVDGRRMDSVDMAGTNWQQISIDEIERIEIIRGSGSVLYGDNSNAGVINIITKKGGPEHIQEVSFWSSSYRGIGGRLGISGIVAGISYRVNVSENISDGYRENSGFSVRSIGGSFGYSVGNIFTLRLNTGYLFNNYGMPGALLQTDLDGGMKRTDTKYPYDEATENNSYIHGIITVAPAENIVLRLQHNYQQKKAVSYFGGWRGLRETYRNTSGLKTIWDTKILNMDNRLTVGGDYDESKLSSWTEIHKYSSAFYFVNEFSPLENLMLNTGLRNQRVIYTRAVNAEKNQTAYNLGLSWLFSDRGRVYANYATTFRFPKTDEMTFSNPALEDGLAAQTSRDIQFGFKYSPVPMVKAGMHFFRSYIQNEIYFDPNVINPNSWTGFGANNNYNETERNSIEIEVKVLPFDFLTIGLNHSIIRAVFADGDYKDNSVPGVPESKFVINCKIQPLDALSINIAVQSIGERYFISDQKNKNDKLPGFTRVDVGLNYILNNFNIRGRINNLFNSKYSEHGVLSGDGIPAYFPSPGRNFIIEIGMKI